MHFDICTIRFIVYMLEKCFLSYMYETMFIDNNYCAPKGVLCH